MYLSRSEIILRHILTSHFGARTFVILFPREKMKKMIDRNACNFEKSSLQKSAWRVDNESLHNNGGWFSERFERKIVGFSFSILKQISTFLQSELTYY